MKGYKYSESKIKTFLFSEYFLKQWYFLTNCTSILIKTLQCIEKVRWKLEGRYIKYSVITKTISSVNQTLQKQTIKNFYFTLKLETHSKAHQKHEHPFLLENIKNEIIRMMLLWKIISTEILFISLTELLSELKLFVIHRSRMLTQFKF